MERSGIEPEPRGKRYVTNSLDHGSDVPRNFVQGGVQQIQLRTEGGENGDLEAVAP
jgi:hypothetical protein